ncbi:MAG: hypothetical protein KGJ90_00425 [Patescibacteria group bacterium]|nr:hypothetical protein [Patescibacteria group bacterium]
MRKIFLVVLTILSIGIFNPKVDAQLSLPAGISQVHTFHPSGGGATCSTTPLDATSETPIIAIGMRRLKNTATKAIQVSINGGTAFDVGFSSSSPCDLDTSALSACTSFSATGCRITKFYDQSGNGCDPAQATLHNQWQVVLNVKNGHPVAESGNDGTANALDYTCTLPSGVTQVTAFAISCPSCYFTSSAGLYSIGTGSGTVNGTIAEFVSSGPNFIGLRGNGSSNSNAAGPAITNAAWGRQLFYLPNGASVAFVANNGSAGSTDATNTTIGSQTAFDFANYQSTSLYYFGYVGELLIYQSFASCSVSSGDCATIGNNQKTYWGTS